MAYRGGQYESPLGGNDLSMTPLWLLDEIRAEFGEFFDPCPANWDESFDGLEISWAKVNFVNPPYSQLARWAKKAEEEWLKGGKTIVMLIPPRTCTTYFHDHIYQKAELRFYRGRLKFRNPSTGEPMQSAPFPSMLCIWRPL